MGQKRKNTQITVIRNRTKAITTDQKNKEITQVMLQHNLTDEMTNS